MTVHLHIDEHEMQIDAIELRTSGPTGISDIGDEMDLPIEIETRDISLRRYVKPSVTSTPLDKQFSACCMRRRIIAHMTSYEC